MYKAHVKVNNYKGFKDVLFLLYKKNCLEYTDQELDEKLIRYKNVDKHSYDCPALHLMSLFSEQEVEELRKYFDGSNDSELRVSEVLLPLDVRSKESKSNYVFVHQLPYNLNGYPISNIELKSNGLSFKLRAWCDLRAYEDNISSGFVGNS